MGVENLWKVVKGQAGTRRWEDFKGQRIGVDAPNIIHSIARRHALALARDADPTALVKETVQFFRAAHQSKGVRLVIVFDGLAPPLKADEAALRHDEKVRAMALPKALLLLKKELQGRLPGIDPVKARDAAAQLDDVAAELCKKGTSLSRFMPAVIDAVRATLVPGGGAPCCDELIVAPMEAEAQLAFLCRTGYIAAAWSGDSDLVMLRTPTIIHDVVKKRLDVLVGADDFSGPQAKGKPNPLAPFADDAALFCLYCSCHRCDYAPFMPPLAPNAAASEAKFLCAAAAAAGKDGKHRNGFQAALDAAAHRSRDRKSVV